MIRSHGLPLGASKTSLPCHEAQEMTQSFPDPFLWVESGPIISFIALKHMLSTSYFMACAPACHLVTYLLYI